jgi:hypothetical protein
VRGAAPARRSAPPRWPWPTVGSLSIKRWQLATGASTGSTLIAIGFYHAAHGATTIGDYPRAALDLARTSDGPLALGQSLDRCDNSPLFLDQPGEAVRYHHEALAIFAVASDCAGFAATHDLLGTIRIMGRDKQAAVRYDREAIVLFRERDDLSELVSALVTVDLRRMSCYHTTPVPADDDYAARVRDGEEALRRAQRIGWRAGEANAWCTWP